MISESDRPRWCSRTTYRARALSRLDEPKRFHLKMRMVVPRSPPRPAHAMGSSPHLRSGALRRLRIVDELLTAWFRKNARDLPWRRTRDPYAILVSEVMLQQTQVERVVPRYRRWLERWPSASALAPAQTADVLRRWQGLGYNRRALNLQRAARIVADGGWPDDLTTLPGVGDYTAAAVRNFAFGDDVLPQDTNVRRIEERTGHAFTPRSAQ